MHQPYTQQWEHPRTVWNSGDGSILMARKHLLIIRHAMDCRQKIRDGVPNRCSFPTCLQMCEVLDHVFTCTHGSDCKFDHCVTCKQLKRHADNCANPDCPVCSNCMQGDDAAPSCKLLQYDINQNSHQMHLTNGNEEQTYQFQSGLNSVHQTTSITMPRPNGCSWRDGYDLSKRGGIVKSHAGQVFPPVTYNDDRAEAVFTLFKDQEEKLFHECRTEEDYKRSLQRFVNRVRDELKHKSRSNPNNISSVNIAPITTPKQEVVSSDQQSEIRLAESYGSYIKLSHSPNVNAANNATHDTAYSDMSSGPLKTEPNSIKVSDCSSVTNVVLKSESSCNTTQETVVSKMQVKSENSRRCVWKNEQLKDAFTSLLEKLLHERGAEYFRTPVPFDDPKYMDYLSIVPNPMDLSTIRKKLNLGDYSEPWDIVDDFWLMFNNAWKYHKKKTNKIYKACSKLSEDFQELVDPIMRSLGFCCGREFVHYPHVLTCNTDKSCNINRNDVYYVYDNSGNNMNKDLLGKYIVCGRCYEKAVNTITIDDQSSLVHLKKSLFEKQTNDTIVYEKFVNCRECGRKWHKVCACHMEEIWPSGFVCQTCATSLGRCRSLNRYTAKRLPTCKLSDFLEKRVNDFIKKNQSQANEVVIRVLASVNKTVEVKKYMRKMYSKCGKFPDSFPYRTKVIFAFQELDGQEVCFFGLYVQEYSSDCPAPNKRRVYIAYLDSVYFFQPKQCRTDVYHEILIGYLLYAKKLGFATAHIWACPPGEGDDYIFHMHPSDQKIPKPKRLQDWYRKMLQKAHNERIVVDYNNIYEDASDTNCLTPTDLPYFDGDLWPNTMEELLKAAEENCRKLREEDSICGDTEVYDDLGEDGDSNQGNFDSDRKPGSAGSSGFSCSKKKTKKRKMKRTTSTLSIGGSSKRKRLGAAGSGTDPEAEVQKRLEEMLQRHAESFLTINLHSWSQVASLQPIKDPDPLFPSEIMECRDNFLGRARERHLEFSTLRRAKFSTLAFLYDIHTENKDAFVYCCNSCQKETEAPRQCKQCPNFYLCDDCFQARGHLHPMEKVVVSDDTANTAAVQQSDRLKMELCVKLLEHTYSCRDANCRNQSCRDLKRRLDHFQTQHDRTKCSSCRHLHRILVAHSTKCNDSACPVVFCAHYKVLKKQHESEQRLRNVQTLRRRQKTMQCSNSNKTPQHSNTPQSTPSTANPTSFAPQLRTSTASPNVFNTPNSSEPPHSFSSQTSLTSPHSVSNSRNSPSKPAQTALSHPSTLQYAHSSPHQQSFHPSPISAALLKGPNSQPQQPYSHLPSPADYHQTPQVTSPFGQQPPIYQQLVQQQLQSPQMQTKRYAMDGTIVRQNSNSVVSPTTLFYENGQATFLRSPAASVTPQMPYKGPAMESEDSYSVLTPGMKRHFFNDSDLVPAIAGGANTYVACGGGKPMMQQSMSAVGLSNNQHQQTVQWNAGTCQIMPEASSTAARVGANRLQQTLPAQQMSPVGHVINSVPQPPSAADLDMVLSAKCSIENDYDFFTWLQQQPHLIPAWNYYRSQQKQTIPPINPYPTQPTSSQQIMRNNVGLIPNFQQQRMMQPGQKPMPNSWSIQQNQQQFVVTQGQRLFRPPCYGSSLGKPAYIQQPQQQNPAMINNSYVTTGFPPSHPSASSANALSEIGGRPNILRNQVPQQQQQRMVSVSPRPPPFPQLQQQQQPQQPLMLSQLLVQSQPQQQSLHQRPQDYMHQQPQLLPPPPPQILPN